MADRVDIAIMALSPAVNDLRRFAASLDLLDLGDADQPYVDERARPCRGLAVWVRWAARTPSAP